MIDTNEFKETLEAELKTLEADLATVGRRNPRNPADWEPVPSPKTVDESDPVDVADEIEDYEEHSAVLKQLEIRYNEVKAALERIKKGDYGRCGVGGEEIEIERLRANPAATTCRKHLAQNM